LNLVTRNIVKDDSLQSRLLLFKTCPLTQYSQDAGREKDGGESQKSLNFCEIKEKGKVLPLGDIIK